MITKPKGTYDVYGIDAKKREYVNEIIKGICQKYNFVNVFCFILFLWRA